METPEAMAKVRILFKINSAQHSDAHHNAETRRPSIYAKANTLHTVL